MPETLRQKRLAWVLGVLIVLTLLFIWGNSLDSRTDSARKSAFFVGLVRPLVLALPIPAWHDEQTIHLITRKLAHFAQFFVLGGLTAGFSLAVWTKSPRRLLWLALFSLAVATIDELLQFISARAPAVMDVALDMAGALSGIALVLLVNWFMRKRRGERLA